MVFWSSAFTLARKDALAEFRTREVLSSALVFALLVIVIFNFTIGSDPQTIPVTAAGMLWVAFTFAGVISLNHSFVSEIEEGCLEGLLAAPISCEAIYLGKMLVNLVFMLIVEAVTLIAFGLLFNLPLLSAQIGVVTLLATIGFSAVGTLFAAVATNTRARELVLPILFLPIVLPVIIAATSATSLVINGEGWAGIATWIGVIIAFDAIFIAVSLMVFPQVLEE